MLRSGSENLERTFRSLREKADCHRNALRNSNVPRITIGMATCGIASGALETKKAFEEALAERNIEALIIPVGCIGHCYAEPVVVMDCPGYPSILYHRVTPGKARMLVQSFLEDGDPLFEHVLGALEENDLVPCVMDFSRFNREKKIVMERCGRINPDEINDYIADGGYLSFLSALQRPPEKIIREIEEAGLRGRGGAGFPTAKKWALARAAEGRQKAVICNADEGDPGAYMDRTILESNPHQVLEGMAVCAYAIGADTAVIYVRAEYPLAVKIVTKAIRHAEACNLLGRGVLGTAFDLNVSVFTGSGAFVCGEETALIQSIEGYRGMPRHRPPYPTHRGLWGRPTVINNVKTFASVPPIMEHGAAWYRGIGTEKSPGTAVFSVVGDVVHAGLVEIPMGVRLRTLIFDICGGIPHKKKFKAVQIGGPSGGCLPADFLDTPIDFDSLKEVGAMMGSGGLVVMDEDTCMVDVARYFLDFTQRESCGKCTFCRIGTRHLRDILDKITKGEGTPDDLLLLEEMSEDIRVGSLCGLGKTAPNPVLTSLRYFGEEYEAHVKEGRCPAGVCRALIAYYIDLNACARGCDVCVGCCPVEAIFTTENRKKGIDQDRCVKCGECLSACPPEYHAVKKVSPPDKAPIIERPPEHQDE